MEAGYGMESGRRFDLPQMPAEAALVLVTVRYRTDKRAKRPYYSAMTDEWNEKLRCPKCGKTGIASLSQGCDISIVQSVPDGFKVIQTEFGPNFRCATCNVAVEP